jgi:hypothetical protein
MKTKNVTLRIDANLYENYRSHCKTNNLLISRQFEILMEKSLGTGYNKKNPSVKKNSFPYVGSLTGEPFMLHENKIVANLLLQNKDLSSIREIIVQENLFGYKTIKSVPKRVNSIIKRIGKLDSKLLDKIANDLSGDGKAVILYSIYRRDRLFQEFMNEIIIEKFSIRDFDFNKKMINKFINDKSDCERKIREFTNETKLKLATVIFNILKESGLVMESGNLSKLNNLFISSDLRNYFENNGDLKFIKSLGVLQ